jgi:hypothetical protein
MVEVFKTNVVDIAAADQLISVLHNHFTDHHANFDLEDCDNILRVENEETTMNVDLIVNLLEEHGFQAAVLEDELEFPLRA